MTITDISTLFLALRDDRIPKHILDAAQVVQVKHG